MNCKFNLVSLLELADVTTGSSNTIDANECGLYDFFDRSQTIKKSDKYLFDCESIIVPGEGQSFIPRYFVGKFDLHQRAYAVLPKKSVNGRFLYYALLLNKKHFEQIAVGSTVKSLRLDSFKTMAVPFPPRHIQDVISRILGTLDDIIALNNSINDYLAA